MTQAAKERIKVRDGRKCTQCGATQSLTIDHIKPKWAGGSNNPSNLTTLCRDCNHKKGNNEKQTFWGRFMYIWHSYEFLTKLQIDLNGGMNNKITQLRSEMITPTRVQLLVDDRVQVKLNSEEFQLKRLVVLQSEKIKEQNARLEALERYLKVEFHEERTVPNTYVKIKRNTENTYRQSQM